MGTRPAFMQAHFSPTQWVFTTLVNIRVMDAGDYNAVFELMQNTPGRTDIDRYSFTPKGNENA